MFSKVNMTPLNKQCCFCFLLLIGVFLAESLGQTTPESLKCSEGSDLLRPSECQNGTGANFPVYFPFQNDCTQFFECTNGLARCVKCAAGTRWDQNNQVCNHADAVDCIIVTTTSRPSKAEDPIDDICPEGYTGLIRHPSDCRLFYDCKIGEDPELYECQDGLYFNPAIKACDWPYNVPDCHGQDQLKPRKAEDSIDEICPEGHTQGFVRHPDDCRLFYFCTNGKLFPHLYECPSGLYFNPALNSCDWPWNVPDCQGGTPSPGIVNYEYTVAAWLRYRIA